LEECVRRVSALLDAERDRADRAQAVLGGVAEPVVATDASGRVVLWNASAAELWSPRVIAGGEALETLFASRELLDVHAQALAGRPGRGQVRLASRGGPRVHEVWATPIDGGAVLTLRDVTDVAAAAQLKTDFVANASHELRTPLTAIRAAVETLAEQAREDPEAARWLIGKILGNLDRLDELTRDLLDLSRLESPEAVVRIGPARASEVVSSASADLMPLFERRGLTLAVDLDPALERLRTDANLLGLILKNLLDNAGKFAFEGTEVRVTGRARGADARFEVRDRGVGIPLEHQSRVFERFYQVDTSRSGSGRGTGLGLAIVKHAARALGGSVGLESVWQRGTTVWVELPGCVEG
jgi:two-component system phosphate regulon sensor histidine kinase PhoR